VVVPDDPPLPPLPPPDPPVLEPPLEAVDDEPDVEDPPLLEEAVEDPLDPLDDPPLDPLVDPPVVFFVDDDDAPAFFLVFDLLVPPDCVP
jgi:hypothetical protein